MPNFHVFGSGSTGNCSLLTSRDGSLLIDAGLGVKHVLRGLQQHNLPLDNIRYILLTHTHSDHIQGLAYLLKQFKVPPTLVSTSNVLDDLSKKSDSPLIESAVSSAKSIRTDGGEMLSPFFIETQRTWHDSPGSCGFRVEHMSSKFSLNYVTDTGFISTRMVKNMINSDVVILESNHDTNLLNISERPAWLKRRIKKNHLSNDQTAKILSKIKDQKQRSIYLAHVSQQCNSSSSILEEMYNFLLQESGNSHDSVLDFPWSWNICPARLNSPISSKDFVSTRDMMSLFQQNSASASDSKREAKKRALDFYLDNH